MPRITAHVTLILPVLQPAGAERIVAELAKRLPRHGFSTSVLCLEDERAPVGDELRKAKIPVAGLRLSRRRSVACARAIAKLIRSADPIFFPAGRKVPLLLHSHLYHANIATRLAFARLEKSQRENIQVIGTIHVAERRFRPWQFLFDKLTAGYARFEVCVSHAVAKFQQEQTGLPPQFFRVIENGIELTRFLPPKNPRKRDGRTVLSVGRLDAQKDFPTLLRAWKILQTDLPDAELVIAGSGPDEDDLRSLAQQLKLNHVKFAGFVNDVPGLMHEADVYAQSSAWEGFGLTVAEAMACALPAVVTNADSLPELVTHDKTGIVVPKGSAEALAKALVKLLQDPKRAAEVGHAAHEEAMRRFSVDRMVADYAKLYQELIESGRT